MKPHSALRIILQTSVRWTLYVLPIFLIGVGFILYGTVQLLQRQTKAEAVFSPPLAVTSDASYPVLTTPNSVTISAQAAIVLDNTSKVVIYEKNPDLRFSPASTTKIMTALVGFDHYQFTDPLTIYNLDTEGKPVGFVRGQQFTFEDILTAMLLPSSNDAALAIADNYPGGRDAFVAKMNEKAKIFQLHNTHFADPIGLEDDQDYTTVTELSRLASIAIENPVFADIVKKKNATITALNSSTTLPLENINILLGYYGIDGIKTGFTDGAKEVLVTTLVKNTHRYIIVVMDSDDRFADTLTLVKNILPNVSYEEIQK